MLSPHVRPVKHFVASAKKKHAITCRASSTDHFQWVNLSDQRFFWIYYCECRKLFHFACLLVLGLSDHSVGIDCLGIFGQGEQKSPRINVKIYRLSCSLDTSNMPPTRRVHASAPVDKYFPSNSLVIGMNIFLFLSSTLLFSFPCIMIDFFSSHVI